MNELNLIDETFDRNQSHNYHLSIQTSANDLSFCLLDNITKKYIALRHYPFKASTNAEYVLNNVTNRISSDDILNLKFRSVSHMLVDSKNTLVPISYFDEAQKAEYFKFNHQPEPNSKVLSSVLHHIATVNVFAYPERLYATLQELFPTVLFSHSSSVFIENIVIDSAKWTQSKCYININSSFLNIGIARNKKLEFYNSFSFKEYSDIVYYILSVLEQFKLSPENTDIYLASSIEKHDEMFGFLNNYLNTSKFIRPTDKFTYSYIFDELHLTRFSNLFNLASCE